MTPVTARRFTLWALLSASPRLTIKELAARFRCGQSAIWRDLVALEELGYIRRRTCGRTGIDVLVTAAYLPPPSKHP